MTKINRSNSVQCHNLLCEAADQIIADGIEEGFAQALVDFVATVSTKTEYKKLLDGETIKRIGNLA